MRGNSETWRIAQDVENCERGRIAGSGVEKGEEGIYWAIIVRWTIPIRPCSAFISTPFPQKKIAGPCDNEDLPSSEFLVRRDHAWVSRLPSAFSR